MGATAATSPGPVEDVFSCGVWVSLSKDNFTRALEMWNTEGREAEKPYSGRLSTELRYRAGGAPRKEQGGIFRGFGLWPQ
ncbi:DUF2199 domain-containing protein [Streptomyces sp. NBC_01190]|uniref:DUF2199 domain-containing protein n=1 Tax=Streptomyces sp. NBC_01190 TaxID=2903767 RepID=UPI003869B52A|nr:DUF2199 domain-containing protein [Streptomyces sp. NBC_01190]